MTYYTYYFDPYLAFIYSAIALVIVFGLIVREGYLSYEQKDIPGKGIKLVWKTTLKMEE